MIFSRLILEKHYKAKKVKLATLKKIIAENSFTPSATFEAKRVGWKIAPKRESFYDQILPCWILIFQWLFDAKPEKFQA